MQSGDIAGVMPALSRFSEYADKVYDEDYGELRSAQAEADRLRSAMCEALGDILREGHWQDASYVDGDEDKLYKDALEKLKVIAQPEVKYSIKYNDNKYAQPDNDDWHVFDLTKNVEWPWITTQTAAHLLDPEIGVDVWAYVDKINRNYSDPKKTTININTNLSTITQHSFGDVLANIASVATETRTSSRGGLKTLQEGIGKTDAAAIMYQQQQTASNDALSTTIAGMQTIINEIRDNYISATTISGYSTVEQTSDAITSTVASIQKEFNGGANLIKESNFFLYKTDQDCDATFYRLDLAEEYSNDIFVGQYMTLSYYLESLGERTALFGGRSQFDNYFGAGVSVVWGSRTSIEEDVIRDYMFDLCEIEGQGRRVSTTARIDPPEGHYDMIKDIWVSVQLGARPADGNENTWVFGQPQLEMGKFCTGYKESAFEIKAYSESMIRQTASEITAQIQALTDEYDKSTKVTLTPDGRIQVSSSTEAQTVTMDPDPYAHPVSQVAITSSPTTAPKEQEWRDSEGTDENELITNWKAANEGKDPYMWKRSVVISNGTIVRATQPECIDAVSTVHKTILEANDEYCYTENQLKVIHPEPGTISSGMTTFSYVGNYTWEITKLDQGKPDKNYYYLWSYQNGMPKGIRAGDSVPISIEKEETNNNIDLDIVCYPSLNSASGRKEFTFTESGIVNIPSNTVGISIVIRNMSEAPVSAHRIGIKMFAMPGAGATWISEYRGIRDGTGVWSRTNITYNDSTSRTTDPVFMNNDGIRNVDIQYAVLTKGDQPDENTQWMIRIAGIVDATQVVWTRVKYTYNDGTMYATEPSVLRGSNVQEEQPKVSDVATLYYNSDGESLTETEVNNHDLWKETVEYESEKTMWSRNRITYTDGSIVWSTPQVCSVTNALYVNDDLTIIDVEVRYAAGDSAFVPPPDTAPWDTTLPTMTDTENNVWFSVWTTCRNGVIYRGIPVFITDGVITDPQPMWTIINGNEKPAWDNETQEWKELNDENTSYKMRGTEIDKKHMWVYVQYTSGESTVKSEIARARYYDNLSDGGYDVHKSYEAMLNDKYVRELYEVRYNDDGSTLSSDINKMLETAKGTYRYLLSDENASISEYTADHVYEKLTADGAISELKRTAEEILMSVGKTSKNKVEHSDKIEVIDYARDDNEPVECALSDEFDIDNSKADGGEPVDLDKTTVNIGTAAQKTISTMPDPMITEKTTVSSKNINSYNNNTFNAMTYEEVAIQNIETVNHVSKGVINFNVKALAYDIKQKPSIKARITFIELLDNGQERTFYTTEDGAVTLSYIGSATSTEATDAGISYTKLTIPYVFQNETDQTIVFTKMRIIVSLFSNYYFRAATDITYYLKTETNKKHETITGYTAVSDTIISGIRFNSDQFSSSIGFSLYGEFGDINTGSDEDAKMEEMRMQIFEVGSEEQDGPIYEYDIIPTVEENTEEESASGKKTFRQVFYKSDFEKNKAYYIKLVSVYAEREYMCTISNLAMNRYNISDIEDHFVPLTGELEAGAKYIIRISAGSMTSVKTGESDSDINGITLGIPIMNGDKEDWNLTEYIPFDVVNGHPTGNFEDYTYVIDSLERKDIIKVFAGKNLKTQGKHVQLSGVSVVKFPRFASESGNLPYVNTNTFYGRNISAESGAEYMLSVQSIRNNDFTYCNDGKTVTRNASLLEHIAADKVWCQIFERSENGGEANCIADKELNVSEEIQYFTFQTRKNYVYWARLYSNSPLNGSKKRGGSVSYRKLQIEEIDGDNPSDDQGKAMPTEWQPAIGEVSPEFANNAIVINNDGITATGGSINIQAGSTFTVGSEGTVTIQSTSEESSIRFGEEKLIQEGSDEIAFRSSFEVTSDGSLYSRKAYFDDLRVDGMSITPKGIQDYIDDKITQMFKEYFVHCYKVEDLPNPPPSHPYYWIRPNAPDMSGDTHETVLKRHYNMVTEKYVTSSVRVATATFNVEPFEKINTPSVRYQIHFKLSNATSGLGQYSMWVHGIRLRAKGIDPSGAEREYTVYDKTYGTDNMPTIRVGYYIELDIISAMERNIAFGGSFKFMVDISLGWDRSKYDNEVKVGYGKDGFDVTVYVPPKDASVHLGSVSAFPHDVYYIPANQKVVASGEEETEQEQTGE